MRLLAMREVHVDCSACQATLPVEDAVCPSCGKKSGELRDKVNEPTPHGACSVRKHASWIRVVSYGIDFVLILVCCAMLGMLLGPLGLLDNMHDNEAALVVCIVSGLYYILQEGSSIQATIGKRIVGIVVTDFNGDRISFLRAAGRYFAKMLSGIFFGAGFIMIALSKQKVGLHDCLAGTYVVYRKRVKPTV